MVNRNLLGVVGLVSCLSFCANLDHPAVYGKSTFGNIDIMFQNVRGLHTKCSNFSDTICAQYYRIICIAEMWLNDSVCNHVFPNVYSVYHADRDYSNSTYLAVIAWLSLFINLLLDSNIDSGLNL
jgi:hypothetical protein